GLFNTTQENNVIKPLRPLKRCSSKTQISYVTTKSRENERSFYKQHPDVIQLESHYESLEQLGIEFGEHCLELLD
ncbi:hypothetical protein RMSM_03287, partial [Rhodopirellula maiorica SM1]